MTGRSFQLLGLTLFLAELRSGSCFLPPSLLVDASLCPTSLISSSLLLQNDSKIDILSSSSSTVELEKAESVTTINSDCPHAPNTSYLVQCIPLISMPVWSLAAPCVARSVPLSPQNPSYVTSRQQREQPTTETSTSTPTKISATSAPSAMTTSMNIVTFASLVSVAAPKLLMVSLYHNTLTKDSFLSAGLGVLQLLTPSQKQLVDVLGKHSGYKAFTLETINNYNEDQNVNTNDGYSSTTASASASAFVLASSQNNTRHHHYYCKQDECDALGFGWIDASPWIHQYRIPLLGPSQSSFSSFSSLTLLPECALYILLKHVGQKQLLDAVDHQIILCEVVASGVWDAHIRQVVDHPSSSNAISSSLSSSSSTILLDPRSVLYTGQLREEGLL